MLNQLMRRCRAVPRLAGGRRFLPLAALLLAALTGGCGVVDLQTQADLERTIAKDAKPVLVDFYKAGCKDCGAFEITLRMLAEEYAGQITAAKFLLQLADGTVTAPELAEKYEILVYPTAILFVDGKEAKRFEQDYTYDHYTQAIEAALASSNVPKGPAEKPPAGKGSP